ncbi:MAG TPA: hypothetical protein VGV36_01965 [Solirubrobacteraceae bacterium]|nr:hypothetical protein [Solirubrobacteraceae bacterium]
MAGFETALQQWREGERRAVGASPDERHAVELVIDRIVAQLRRKLGGAFTVDELVALYEREGTGWTLDIAVRAAPDQPRAWDERTVGDAAFHRYLREAVDYAGGRRLSA